MNAKSHSEEDSFHLGIKALITNEEGKHLLLKVNPTRLKNYDKPAYWDIPGGRLERGETVEDTLKRELEEETGITSVKATRPLAMVLSNIRIPLETGDVGLILSINVCEVEGSERIIISAEHTEYGWFTSDEAADLLQVKYPAEFTDKIRNMVEDAANF